MYYATMKPMIEEELPIKVVGYVPDMKDFALQSRHLGLVMPEEITGIRERFKASYRRNYKDGMCR